MITFRCSVCDSISISAVARLECGTRLVCKSCGKETSVNLSPVDVIIGGDDGEAEDEKICYVCNKPIPEDIMEHWCHEDGCSFQESGTYTCECDIVTHPECCPYCK